MIVSNPPYIRTDVIPTLMDEVRLHEPLLALDGKDDGLYFYRQIIRKAGQYLEENGMLAFEIGFDQGSADRAALRCGIPGCTDHPGSWRTEPCGTWEKVQQRRE